MEASKNHTILGLDLGANSIGWAVLRFCNNEPCALIATGARVFEAGVEGNIEQSKDASRAADRRNARLARRQTERRSRKKTNVCGLLQQAGLLPEGTLKDPVERMVILQDLDHTIHQTHQLTGKDAIK